MQLIYSTNLVKQPVMEDYDEEAIDEDVFQAVSITNCTRLEVHKVHLVPVNYARMVGRLGEIEKKKVKAHVKFLLTQQIQKLGVLFSCISDINYKYCQLDCWTHSFIICCDLMNCPLSRVHHRGIAGRYFVITVDSAKATTYLRCLSHTCCGRRLQLEHVSFAPCDLRTDRNRYYPLDM